jgi:hypothetical protein
MIEYNPNKNLIVSMSIEQGFRERKRRKGKETPQFLSIQMKGLSRSSSNILNHFYDS